MDKSALTNDQAQMTDASLLVLFTADTKAWQKQPERYWVNAPKEVSDLLVGWGLFTKGVSGYRETKRSVQLVWPCKR